MNELFVDRSGPPDGPRVVLVHGTMDRSTSFGRTARRLEGWRVLRFDRRGYGRSVQLGAAAEIDQHVDDLLDVVAGRPSIVAGHSLGGTLAVAAAQRDPGAVVGVVAYEAPLSWMRWWPHGSAGGDAARSRTDPADAAETFMRRMIGDHRWERLPPSARQDRRREGAAMVAEMRSLRAAPAFDPARVTVPVEAAHGSESARHHVKAARVLAEAVPAGELHCVEGASHGVHLTHPGPFADLVGVAGKRAGLS